MDATRMQGPLRWLTGGRWLFGELVDRHGLPYSLGMSLPGGLANAVAGWREGAASGGSTWHLPANAAIVRARQRAGARLFRMLFHAVAGPIATAQTVGHSWAGFA